VLLASFLLAPSAFARSDVHDLSVQEAVQSGTGSDKLLSDVRFFMKGQKHPGIAKDMGTYKANRSTNAFNKSDEQSCQIAFLSALIALQQRAKKEGGDAVVDIVSLTNTDKLESATQFRCTAGNIVTKVALEGRAVKLGK